MGLSLELPTARFNSQDVMPDNQIPAAQPNPKADPAEFNFDNETAENPRIKRRSLKAKPAGLSKPADATVSAARDLEREAPPLSADRPTASLKAQEPAPTKTVSAASKPAETPVAPPRTTPASTVSPAPKTAATSSTTSTSPHGTRPATLYYSSSQASKPKEATPPMKTVPGTSTTTSSSAASSASAQARPAATPAASAAATVRPSTTTSPRASAPVDYRANVDRQAREQKSVGSILSYVVYGLIAIFLLGAGLAGYGANIIFAKLHDQSATVSELDQKYEAANKILTVNLNTTQESLVQAQAQITRQQDVINRQQEQLNKLIGTTNDTLAALKVEKQARTQDSAVLRARIKDIEAREGINR